MDLIRDFRYWLEGKLDSFEYLVSDPRYTEKYRLWYVQYKADVLAELARFNDSQELADLELKKWCDENGVRFWFADGSECCALCAESEVLNSDGWGDDPWTAIDSLKMYVGLPQNGWV